jgi:hypothetical protein
MHTIPRCRTSQNRTTAQMENFLSSCFSFYSVKNSNESSVTTHHNKRKRHKHTILPVFYNNERHVHSKKGVGWICGYKVERQLLLIHTHTLKIFCNMDTSRFLISTFLIGWTDYFVRNPKFAENWY